MAKQSLSFPRSSERGRKADVDGTQSDNGSIEPSEPDEKPLLLAIKWIELRLRSDHKAKI